MLLLARLNKNLTFVLLLIILILATSSAQLDAKVWTIEDFFQHRPDVRDNIKSWSGKTDPEWILREWIKITTERGEDYQLALAILNGTQPSESVTPPADSSPQPSDGFGENTPVSGFVRPADDNGWGVHWFPTVSQSREEVDRFVKIIDELHIKWVLFLNPGTDLNANEYLVDKLVAKGIMPVMRLYYSTIYTPSGEEIEQTGNLVEHFVRRGVHYYQIYNEPNLPCEWEGNVLPENSVSRWADAFIPRAQAVVKAGGIPGIGGPAFGYIKTDGSYGNGSDYFRQMVEKLVSLNQKDLLARSVVVIHNYTTDSPPSDKNQREKYWQFETYQTILGEHDLFLPMIGGEGGTRPEDVGGNMNKLADNVTWCYEHMASAPDYYMSFAHWLLAAPEGNEWRKHAMFDNNGSPLQKELIDRMRAARPPARSSGQGND
ncbi:MAG: hypothetical protein KKB51_14305 [Candidatus Riflebacteria bacterium]|nr:hypothetical protein [Candidatus Riflebacteria bacterium]